MHYMFRTLLIIDDFYRKFPLKQFQLQIKIFTVLFINNFELAIIIVDIPKISLIDVINILLLRIENS